MPRPGKPNVASAGAVAVLARRGINDGATIERRGERCSRLCRTAAGGKVEEREDCGKRQPLIGAPRRLRHRPEHGGRGMGMAGPAGRAL